jgi:hypothetical protein
MTSTELPDARRVTRSTSRSAEYISSKLWVETSEKSAGGCARLGEGEATTRRRLGVV